MNEIFRTTNEIILDENYSLKPDQFKGMILVFKEIRDKQKKDNTIESYQFEDRWYYPKLSMVLNKYLTLKQCESKTLEDLKEITLRVEQTIQQFNK